MNLESGWASYTSAGEEIPAFTAQPPGARIPLPAVVVIHELFGVDAHIEDVTQRIAAAGYQAFAIDLWGAGGGRPPELTRERVEAMRAFLNLNPSGWSGPQAREQVLTTVAEPERSRLQATMARLFGSDEGRSARFVRYTEIARDAVRHLKAEGGASRKVGVVGFCMGGRIAGQLACSEPAVDATVVFYGSPPPIDKISTIACPVLGHYADPDPRITPLIPAFADAMFAERKSFLHHVYTAPHAFFNDTTGAYRPGAARAAWARTLSFLLDHLSA